MKKLLFILFYGTAVAAQVLEVPEKCFSEKKAPCLVKIQSEEQVLFLNKTRIRSTKGTLIRWNFFADETSLSLLKGGFQLEKNSRALKIDGVLVSAENAFIEKKEKYLYVLNIKNFILASYSLSEIQADSVLHKTVFLEKNELLQFISHFFTSRQNFKEFIQSVEQSWKKELISQADTQTKVLNRSLASAEFNENKKKQELVKSQLDLKKVRAEFFYRTFYR